MDPAPGPDAPPGGDDGVAPQVSGEVPTSAPPPKARVLAFLAILFGGATGVFIGYAFTDLQCTGDCAAAKGVGGLVGGIIAAVGVAVVAVLALRAMSEWHTIQQTGEAGNWRDERDLKRRSPTTAERSRPRVR